MSIDMNDDMNMDPIEREREVERWLDAALTQYAKAEPRAGLEGRVLAGLRAERSRLASRRRRWWGAVAAVAAMAAIAVAVWLGQANRAWTPVAGVGTVAIRRNDLTGDRPAVHSVPQPRAGQIAKNASRRPPTRRVTHTPEVARLEQFPAPAPLSDQEKLLARYVREFPHRATLMARAQTEFRKQDELEMTEPWLWPKNTDANGSENGSERPD